jgi:hypothetical protein
MGLLSRLSLPLTPRGMLFDSTGRERKEGGGGEGRVKPARLAASRPRVCVPWSSQPVYGDGLHILCMLQPHH